MALAHPEPPAFVCSPFPSLMHRGSDLVKINWIRTQPKRKL